MTTLRIIERADAPSSRAPGRSSASFACDRDSRRYLGLVGTADQGAIRAKGIQSDGFLQLVMERLTYVMR